MVLAIKTIVERLLFIKPCHQKGFRKSLASPQLADDASNSTDATTSLYEESTRADIVYISSEENESSETAWGWFATFIENDEDFDEYIEEKEHDSLRGHILFDTSDM